MSTFANSDYNAALYRDARPAYDARLFDRIDAFRGVPCSNSLAIDIGSGTGQIAFNLAANRGYKRVIAIEPSAVMRGSALRHPNIQYVDGTSDHLTAEDGTADLVIAAQAAHWFDMPKFLAEAKRVLNPETGVLALLCYATIEFPTCPEATKLLWELAEHPDKLQPYWMNGSIHIRRIYTRWSNFGEFNGKVTQLLYPETDFVAKFGVVEDFDEEELRKINDERSKTVKVEYLDEPVLKLDLTLRQLRAFLKTWSGYKRYMDANPGKPDIVDVTIDQVASEILKATGEEPAEDTPLPMNWQHTLILAKP
ncbi:S-adenosyl-L-methionine-dependent methyltransferase [Ramicandelaber brevisporus]|nr:S-adenosyl-L-methionine-dependent methyltransferase [Ramicandelaber brevisporus]